jgi:hypothetical protein
VGAVTAVAVWNHAPTADELLAVRLAAGWRPTPSRLKSGETILGHACSAGVEIERNATRMR